MDTIYYLIAGGGFLLFAISLLWISGNKPGFIPDFPINIMQAPKRNRRELPKGYVKPSELPLDIRDHDVETIKELRRLNPGVRFYHKWQDIPYSFSGGSYTIRPYTQGFGCDGTTRDNIYLQVKVYCKRRGWNFKEIYREVHHNEAGDWIDNLEKVRHETIIPHKISPHLLIADLRDINSYGMVNALEAKMEKEGLIRKR